MLSDFRARRRIEHRRRQTLFVEAGAGTGKTTALVQRIANLATHRRNPVPMAQIAAITFTEKAAGELRERLRKELERRARETPGEAVAKALHELDQASLQTIHGFVRSILARFPLEAGLPPGFTLLDEIQSSLRFEEWWNDLLEELLEDETLADAWYAAIDAGMSPSRLKKVAEVFRSIGNRLPAEDLAPLQDSTESLFPLLTAIGAHAETLADLLAQCTAPEADLLAKKIAEIAPWVDELTTVAGMSGSPVACREIRDVVRRRPKRFGAAGSDKNWPAGKGVVRNAATPFFEAVEELEQRLDATALMDEIAPLVNRVRRAVAEDAGRRRSDGTLEFEDLLVIAARMLREHAAVRDRLRQEIACLLVDEFQDTDPLQVEIVALLCADNGGDPEFRWESAEVPAGKLFFVGDPKQSIYRFRNADVSVYQAVKETLAGKVVTLDTNFRSTGGVIEFVNETFANLFAAEHERGQATYVDLQPFADLARHADEQVVHVLGGPRSGPDAQVSTMRQTEAKEIADLVRCAVCGDAPWRVRVGRTDEFRPARFADITVLFPTRTSLRLIERQLDESGVPYRVDSRSLLFETQEVRDLLNLAQAIEDPSDEVAVLGALRSPAFGCTDADLLAYGGPWNYLRMRDVAGPVARAMGVLRDYHEDRHRQSVGVFLERVVRERHLMELAVVQRRPRDHWRRIGLVLDYARGYDESTHGTLRGFLTWVRTLADRDARVNETVVAEPDDDAVRLTTIHAAKGLEYPIVVMAGILSHYGRVDPVRVAWDDDGRFQLHLGSVPRVQTLGAAETLAGAKLLDHLESDRLLYVAATRAKDHLALCLYHDGRDVQEGEHGDEEGESRATKDSLARRLYMAMPSDRRSPHTFGSIPTVPSSQRIIDVSTLPKRDEWIAHRSAGLAKSRPLPTRAPTTLAKEVHAWKTGGANQAFTPVRRSRPQGGPDLGRAVHTVLQTIDLQQPIEAHEAVILAQANAERQRPEEVRELVARALRSSVIREAAECECWREIFLSAFVEGVLIEGYVDLLYRRSDGTYVVVDYKTDAVRSASDVAKRMETYRYQGAAYAMAMERTLKSLPRSVKFSFLTLDRHEEVAELGAAMADVRDYLRWLVSTGDLSASVEDLDDEDTVAMGEV